MKNKTLSGGSQSLKTCKTIILVILALFMSIALMCFASCKIRSNDSSGDNSSSSDSVDDDWPDDDSDDSGNSGENENGKIVLETISDAGSVKIVADTVRAYLSAATTEEQIAALPETKLAEDCGALPVRLAWGGNGSVKYTLYLADNKGFEDAKTYVVSGLQNEIEVYNLLPSTTYYWKVEGNKQNDTSDVSSFTTENLPVRMIYADGTSNVRDMGGWQAGNAVVNYGKLYRGNQLNGYGSWGNNKLTEDGLNTFKNDLKIRTEIDFRTQGKDDADQTENYIDASYPYYKCTVGQYTDILDALVWNALPNDGNTKSDTKDNKNDARRIAYATGNAVRNENAMKRSIKTVFEVLADENNYPVYMHCNAGADRTGTVAFLVNGLLGVGESDLIRDYELTSFSAVSGLRYRSALKDGAFTEIGVMQNNYDNFIAFGALLNAIKSNYGEDGKPLSYAIESFLTDYIGVSHGDIENIKRIMLSDYTADDVVYIDGERQVIEVAKTDNTVNLGNIRYDSVERISFNGADLGTSLSAINGGDLAGVYGERELTVTVNTSDGRKTVKVPVLVVTKYITTAEELKEVLTVTTERNYGYYELKNDITLDAFSAVGNVRFTGKNGFCGIFDGKGHTITSALGAHGLFGFVSGGATIRNVKFVVNGGVNEAGKSVIGDYVHDSFIENIEIKVANGDFGVGTDGIGLITSKSFRGNSVKNLTVNAENAELNSMFGCSEEYAFGGNVFETCVVNVKAINELARYYVNGSYVSVYLENVYGFDGIVSEVIEIIVADIVNVKESNVELTVGERFAGSKVVSVVGNGISIKDYKFENGVLYLFNERDVFGDNLGKTTIDVVFEAVNGIEISAKIYAVVFTNSEEVIFDETQEIFLNRAESAVDLKEYAGATVYSISCEGYYFGNDENALDISAEFRSNGTLHGSRTLSVLLGKDDRFYTVRIPVTIVTSEISDLAQLNALLKSDVAGYAVYGYYKLIADIGKSADAVNNGNDVNWQNVDGLFGFRGTLDGNGRSITGTVYSKGIFGIVGSGAVIKDLTVNAYGYANGRAILARSIRNAVVENVTINIKSGESVSYYTEGGVITGLMSHSTAYRNVTVNSNGAVDTLFGCSYWNYDDRKANTFAEVKVNVKSIGGLLCVRANVPESLRSLDGIEGITVSFVRSYEDADNTILVGDDSSVLTIGSDNADITEISSVTFDGRNIAFGFADGKLTVTEAFGISDIGAKILTVIGKVGDKNVTLYLSVNIVLPAEEVSLDGTREVVLTDATEYDFDLGDYSSATVLGASLGGENIDYANGKLIVSGDYKSNTRKHGKQILSVTVEKNGKYYVVTANVLVVTKAISTIDELTTAMTAGAANTVFGYYRLTQNVGSKEAWINVQNNGDWKNADGSVGFRGTLDGNGYAVDGNFATHGLFGIIGNGAIVRNITFNVYYYQNGRQTLARSITGATIEDVTINIKSIYKTLDATAEGGVITGLLSHTSTYKNVTINAKNYDLDTLFGKSYGNYKTEKANTFVGCVVNAKSLAGLVHSNAVIPATGIDGLEIILFPDDIVAEEQLEIGNEYTISLGSVVSEITGITLGEEIFDAYSFADGVLTVNADAFGVTDAGNKIFAVRGKNADGCTVNVNVVIAAEFKATAVTLDGTREIVLSDADGYALDLGDYSSATVLSAVLGGDSVSYANGKLTLTNEFKKNAQKHGNNTLNLTVEKDGKYYNVTANVLVITGEITTLDELKSSLALSVKNNIKVRYGYYRLNNDLTYSGWYQSGYDGLAGLRTDPNAGFRGVFDGNNKTITTFFAEPGLFGIVGTGAVIKNLTISMSSWDSRFMAFGYGMIGATVENVTVNVKGDGITDIPTDKVSGLLTSIGAYGNTFKNLTINASNTNVDTLFGNCKYGYSYPTGAVNTFENCTVNIKSLIGLVCTDNANKTVLPYTNVNGLTVNLAK